MRGIFIPGRWRDKEEREMRERREADREQKGGEIKG